ncbi:helix-turn-helix domain-containing protein [Zhaonella formicivorans]|uniref:helix-turn-helix domain-containing protein n=1 Tax=Zhaonella formicivorans TaxID=2528593 RepID=UPI0010D18C91|nr:helix-turn-helix domain-containing protein [Zhaonella formicivorans]
MHLLRIGDKLLDRERIITTIDEILNLRLQGLSQQDVANRLNVDRTFISRLEGIGEVRRGGKVAVVGFPIANKKELEQILEEEGIEFYLIMTDEERWRFISDKTGQQLLNDIMDLIAKARAFDVILVIGSNYRIKLCQALVDKEVVGVEIGISPIQEDVYVDPETIRKLVKTLKR